MDYKTLKWSMNRSGNKDYAGYITRLWAKPNVWVKTDKSFSLQPTVVSNLWKPSITKKKSLAYHFYHRYRKNIKIWQLALSLVMHTPSTNTSTQIPSIFNDFPPIFSHLVITNHCPPLSTANPFASSACSWILDPFSLLTALTSH